MRESAFGLEEVLMMGGHEVDVFKNRESVHEGINNRSPSPVVMKSRNRLATTTYAGSTGQAMY